MNVRYIGALLLYAAIGRSQAAFEVASVKPLPGNVFRAGILISGNRVTASGPLNHLIQLAYNLKDYQVVGGPDWATSGNLLYEVMAKVEGEAPPARQEVREMLQNLLAERFRLSIHRATKELPVYSLVIGQDGPKLKKSAPDAKMDSTFMSGPASRITATETVPSLANQLELATGLPVLDKTGLSGPYEIKLEWSSDDGPVGITSDPSLFAALQKQLGLKLQASRELLPVLVIDHVEKPSEN